MITQERYNTVLKDLKNHSHTLVENLSELTKKTNSYAEQLNFEKNDLRKTVFIKYGAILNSFILGTVITTHDNTLEFLSKTIVCENARSLEGNDSVTLMNFFNFCYRNVLSEFLETFEHLLFESWQHIGTNISNKDPISFGKLVDSFEKKGMLSNKEKDLLKKQMNEKRNPRHHNFFDINAQSPMQYTFPIDTQMFSKMIERTKNFVQHPKIKELQIVEDKILSI